MEKSQISLVLPLEVFTTKSKTKKGKFILNLNNFRNTHFTKLNNSKKAFKESVKDEVKRQTRLIKNPKQGTYQLDYYIYPTSKRLFDTANVCSIIDKFLCDVLTELDFWEDDNYKILPRVTYNFGEIISKDQSIEAGYGEKGYCVCILTHHHF